VAKRYRVTGDLELLLQLLAKDREP